MITESRDLVLLLFTADCKAPVFLSAFLDSTYDKISIPGERVVLE